MRAFYHPDQALHSPQQFMRFGQIGRSTDVPARTAELLAALDRLGVTPETPTDYGRAPAETIHAKHYIDFLESAYKRWIQQPDHGPEVWPNTFPYWNGDPGHDMRPPCPSELVIAQAYARNPGEALPDDLTVLVLRRAVAQPDA